MQSFAGIYRKFARQVEWSSDGVLVQSHNCSICADIRLDNRQELLSSLDLQSNATDTELVLHAYLKWGKGCPRRLLGDFAFAIWDERKQELFCARDHMGLRPFYFYEDEDCFAFASDMRILLAHSFIPKDLREERIADYLIDSLEGYDYRVTFFMHIYRLPAAHLKVVDRDQDYELRYWTLEPERELVLASREEYAEAFLEKFTLAMKCRVSDATSVATMLSGGMDSSAIAAIANEHLGTNQKLKTYSCVSYLNEHVNRESQAILTMIAELDSDATLVSSESDRGFASEVDSLLSNSTDVFDTLIAHVPLTLYAKAAHANERALINGIDGDRICSQKSGVIRYLLRNWRFGEALRLSREYSDFYETNPFYDLFSQGKFFWSDYLSIPYDNPLVVRIRRHRLRNQIESEVQSSGIRPEFLEKIDIAGRLQESINSQLRYTEGTPREHHINSIHHAGFSAAIERYERVGRMYGVESLAPFLDKRLVEFCVSLPFSEKFSSLGSKPLLRRAMRGKLPDEILERKNFEHVGWAFQDEYLRNNEEEIASWSFSNVESYIDPKKSEDLWKTFMLSKWLGSLPNRSIRSEAFCANFRMQSNL